MQNDRGGFTLIEFIVYVAIFAIIGTLGATLLEYGLRSKKTTGRMGEVYLTAERAMSQIVDRVHSATAVASASGSTLQLIMASSSQSPTFISLLNSEITLKEGSNATTTLTSSSTIFIQSLSFTAVKNPSPSATSVQVMMTAGYNDSGSVDTGTLYTLQTTALPL